MKPMTEAAVQKCLLALVPLSHAAQIESEACNFEAVIQLASIGRQLYNLTHNGEVVETEPNPPPTARG